jgi:type IV secretion system protein TrbL
MTLIEAYIMIGAGAVMLGFTGSRWTMSFGEKWIGYAFSIGVKLFVIYVIVALGITIFPANCPSGNDTAGICAQLQAINGTPLSIDITNFSSSTFNISTIFTAYLEIAAAAIIFMMLCQRLPGLAAAMMNGSPNLTMGAAMSTTMQVAGAIAGVAKAGAGAAAGMAGMPMGGGAGAGGGGGLMEAASLGGGVGVGGGGGTMSLSGLGGLGAEGGLTGASGAPGAPGGSAASGAVGGSASAKGAAAVTTIGKELVAAASSAASPLLKFDEGGGGGSVHIGLRLPE